MPLVDNQSLFIRAWFRLRPFSSIHSPFACLVLLSCIAHAQPEPAIGGRNLVLENNYVKVTRVLTATGGGRSAAHDSVVIPLAIDPSIEAVASISYLPAGTKMAWPSAPEVLLVEIKKHREVAMRSCDDAVACVRKIMVGEAQVGERRQLFTSGFVTGSLQQLLPGGTLTSTYYSEKGVDHVLIVALTDGTFLLDGMEQKLQAGQVAFTGAKEVEVSAGPKQTGWFTLRLNDPK